VETVSTTSWRVLVVSNSENRDVVQSAMSHWSMESVCCSGVQEARGLLPEAKPSLIFCDETLADGTYRDLLSALGKSAKVRLIVISAASDLDAQYNEAMTLGAFDLIASPCRRNDVQWIAIRAMQEERRRSSNRHRPKIVLNREQSPPSEGVPRDAAKESSQGSE
jgi:DNA-binding NtrC family response regulator